MGATSNHCRLQFLSTLSLRRATLTLSCLSSSTKISIHALLTESDRVRGRGKRLHHTFLSTLSLRRATFNCGVTLPPHKHFYPRSPYGERLIANLTVLHNSEISIHALLTESDIIIGADIDDIVISIHALLTESDFRQSTAKISSFVFLSTLSLRRATPG